MEITGKTKIVGIFGFPVSHSFSPLIHNTAIQELGLDFAYVPFCVKPDNLREACRAIRALDIVGVNVTVPHKQKIMEFLDKIDPIAEMIGAVNTIYNNKGELVGYNTDGVGFINSLKKEGLFDPLGKCAFLIGGGGAGHALAVMLAKEGIKKLLLSDIEPGKSQVLFNRIRKYFNKCEVKVVDFKEKNLCEEMPKVNILLNATPVGMKEGDLSIVRKESLREDLFVYDVVYNRETSLLKCAKQVGAKTMGGLGMLLNQGVLSFKIWTGKDAPIEVMREVLKRQITTE